MLILQQGKCFSTLNTTDLHGIKKNYDYFSLYLSGCDIGMGLIPKLKNKTWVINNPQCYNLWKRLSIFSSSELWFFAFRKNNVQLVFCYSAYLWLWLAIHSFMATTLVLWTPLHLYVFFVYLFMFQVGWECLKRKKFEMKGQSKF